MTVPFLSRFVLVPDLRTVAETPVAPIRRYRLSRVPAQTQCDRERFAYLKKSYD